MTIEATQAVNEAETQQQDQNLEEQQAEVTETEYVIEGDEDTSASETVPLPTFLEAKRKLKDKLNGVKAENDDVSSANAKLKRENDLLKLQLEQGQQQGAAFPKLEEYDFDETAYQAAVVEYTANQARGIVREELSTHDKTTQQSQRVQEFDSVIDQTLEKHWTEANELGIKNYDEAIGVFTQAVGEDSVQHLLTVMDAKSVNYLVKHPAQLDAYVKGLKNNPVVGIAKFAELKHGLKPKSVQQSTTEPDTPLEGGAAGGNSFQVRLDKARKLLRDDGSRDMDAIKAVKREAQEAGVAVS